jgi:hypothetical protein
MPMEVCLVDRNPAKTLAGVVLACAGMCSPNLGLLSQSRVLGGYDMKDF